jgi:sugar phosphate permease
MQYAAVNSVVLAGVGLISSILGGIVADKYEKNTLWIKALICIIGSAAALPLMAVATL